MNKDVSAILEQAADLVERGWCQRAFHIYGDQDRYCLTGAINAAGGGVGTSHPAYRAMTRAVGEAWLSHWNDAPERTQAEVVAKLREVAKANRAI